MESVVRPTDRPVPVWRKPDAPAEATWAALGLASTAILILLLAPLVWLCLRRRRENIDPEKVASEMSSRRSSLESNTPRPLNSTSTPHLPLNNDPPPPIISTVPPTPPPVQPPMDPPRDAPSSSL